MLIWVVCLKRTKSASSEARLLFMLENIGSSFKELVLHVMSGSDLSSMAWSSFSMVVGF